MSDVIDDAVKQQDLNLSIALNKRQPMLERTGRCHWCSAPVQSDAAFCDTECRDDHAQHNRLNGGW